VRLFSDVLRWHLRTTSHLSDSGKACKFNCISRYRCFAYQGFTLFVTLSSERLGIQSESNWKSERAFIPMISANSKRQVVSSKWHRHIGRVWSLFRLYVDGMTPSTGVEQTWTMKHSSADPEPEPESWTRNSASAHYLAKQLAQQKTPILECLYHELKS
jgi:hypothetical protein